jgi:hypothetical protein
MFFLEYLRKYKKLNEIVLYRSRNHPHMELIREKPRPTNSVADPDPGSGTFLTPGSEIRNRFFPDPGSRIPDPTIISESLKPIFSWVKK